VVDTVAWHPEVPELEPDVEVEVDVEVECVDVDVEVDVLCVDVEVEVDVDVAWVDVDVEVEAAADPDPELEQGVVAHSHVAASLQVGAPPLQATLCIVTTGLFQPRESTHPAMLGSLRSK